MPLLEADSMLINYQEIVDPQPEKQRVRKRSGLKAQSDKPLKAQG